MKKTKKTVTAILTLCLLLLFALPSQAETATGLFVAAGYDGNGNRLQASVAVAAAYADGIFVDTDISILSSDAVEYRLITNTGEFSMQLFLQLPELGIAEFYVNDPDNQVSAPAAVSLYKGEEVVLCYYDTDAVVNTCPIQINGFAQEYETSYLYDFEIIGELKENYLFPMSILDDSGNLAGYVSIKGGYVYSYIYDEEAFTSGGGSGGGAGQGNTGGSGGQGGSGQSGTGTGSGGSRPVVAGSDSPAIGYVVAGVVAMVAVLGGIFVVVSKKKKTQTASASPNGNAPASVPSFGMDAIPPTEASVPFSAASGAPSSAQQRRVTPILYGQGGVMDGRRYALTSEKLTIGRDKSCTVCYPENTPGVSRSHCTIFWNNGVLMIMDTSSGGTFLQSTGRLTPHQPTALKNGDIIYLGEKKNAFVLRFE